MKTFESKKIILITGCSSGFGLLMAARLASRGHKVIATMRDIGKQSALLSEVNKLGADLDVFELDVTDHHSIERLMAQIFESYDYVDVLINNAGYGVGGAFEDLTDREIRDQMETNFYGALNMMRKVIPIMRQRRSGQIINISSIAGLSASPCFCAYTSSKWALEGFSESIRYELEKFGIDISLIEPGTYKTKIFFENRRQAKNFDNPDSPYFPLSKHLLSKVMDRVHDCHKDPEEVAALAEKIINAKKPAFRNVPDLESKVLLILRRFLPFAWYSKIVNHFCFKGLAMNRDHDKLEQQQRQGV